MASLTFSLPGHPANDNVRRRWHWSKRNEEDDLWKEDARRVCIDAINRQRLVVPWPRVHVTYQFVKPTKQRMDTDNAGGATKPILDGIVMAGLIPDDSGEYVSAVTTLAPLYIKGVREVRVRVDEDVVE
jgi:hypothetical protein